MFKQTCRAFVIVKDAHVSHADVYRLVERLLIVRWRSTTTAFVIRAIVALLELEVLLNIRLFNGNTAIECRGAFNDKKLYPVESHRLPTIRI